MSTHTANLARRNPALASTFDLAGRILLVVLFLVSGFGKLTAYSATAGYMASAGVPSFMLPLVIALEIGGSIAIILGWHTRVIAFLMAGFTLLTAVLFHTNLGDQVQQLMFMKNLAIAGAFLLLVAHGAGAYSLDARKRD
jgi:putative oxidoreductase